MFSPAELKQINLSGFLAYRNVQGATVVILTVVAAWALASHFKVLHQSQQPLVYLDDNHTDPGVGLRGKNYPKVLKYWDT